MHFSLIFLLPFFTFTSASGIFAITGTGSTNTTSTSLTLTVLNGDSTAPPVCTGTSIIASALPVSGTVPCSTGFALSYVWGEVDGGVIATYTNPTVTYIYNVPNNGCTGGTCKFGFTDLFPKKARGFKA